MNESELIQAARGGDEAAFEQLVRLHEKKIYNLCLRMCGSSEDAAEAAQDTFLALWRGLEGFREDAALSTWLYRLASNACIDLLRRNKRTVDGVSLDDEDVHLEVRDRAPTPEEHVEGRETQRLVREGLAALPEDYRRDFSLVFLLVFCTATRRRRTIRKRSPTPKRRRCASSTMPSRAPRAKNARPRWRRRRRSSAPARNTRRKKRNVVPTCRSRNAAYSKRKKTSTARPTRSRRRKRPLPRSTPLWTRRTKRSRSSSAARPRCSSASPALRLTRPRNT